MSVTLFPGMHICEQCGGVHDGSYKTLGGDYCVDCVTEILWNKCKSLGLNVEHSGSKMILRIRCINALRSVGVLD